MKYIIDIPDDRVRDYVGSTHLLMPYAMAENKGHHDTGLNLTPYTEPDRKDIEDEVWETIRKIFTNEIFSGDEDNDPVPFYDCFGEYYFHELLRNMSYQEAKAKYESWKAEREQIRVGDEVQAWEHALSSVVVGIAYGSANLLYDGGALGQAPINELIKTGRHFPEVEELLNKIKENKRLCQCEIGQNEK